MANEDFLSTLIALLTGQAQPRPDIITPRSTGALENARPFTSASRVGTAGSSETLQQIPKRLPMSGSEEGGGLFTSGLAALRQYMPQLAASAATKLEPSLPQPEASTPMLKTLEQLRKEAGSRGFMLLGRHVPKDSKETIGQIMARLPTESPDAEGLGALATSAASAPLVARASKVLKPAATGVAEAETSRTLGSKVFKSLNLDEPAKAFSYLAQKNINPRELSVLTSSQGGRAGVLLPNGEMIFRATHGEAVAAIPDWAKGRVNPITDMVLDVQTPYGRSLLTVGQLENLRLGYQAPQVTSKITKLR